MDPITMVMAGLSAVGSLLGGVTSFLGGNAAKKQADRRAEFYGQEAGIEAKARLEEADRVGGSAAVNAAHNGGGADSSSVDVLQDIERTGMFNARSALWAGRTKAENARFEGRVAKKEGTLKLIGGVIGAGSSLAGGWGKAAEAGKQANLSNDILAQRMS